MIDATLHFVPEHLSQEQLASYFRKAITESEFALLIAQNQYQAQRVAHQALIDQRDRLLKFQPKAD